MQRRGPDSLEGWSIALICCLISTLMFGSAGLSSMLFVAAISRYDTDRNKAAFPFILCNVLQAATGPFAGYFARRFSERTVLVAGSIFAFVGIGTCFFAESITTVAVLWGVVFGLGFGFSTLLLPAIINNFFYKHRSKALGMSYLGSPIGFLIFPPIFEILLNEYGLSGTFLFLCAINMHCVPLSMLLRQPDFKETGASHPLNHSKDQATYLSTSSTTAILKTPMQNGEIRPAVRNPHDNSNLRRFSLEFLWSQASSTGDSKEGNRQFICSLNDKRYGKIYERSECARSYERLNRSQYEDLDDSSKIFKTFTSTYPPEIGKNLVASISAKSVSRGIGFNGQQFEFLHELRKIGSEKLTNQPVDTLKRSLKVMEAESIISGQDRTHTHNYTQFSSIYFGSYQQSRLADRPAGSLVNKSNFIINKNSLREKLYGSFSNSFQEPYIASTTSISPLVTDTKENNTPESLESGCPGNSSRGTSGNRSASLLSSVYCNPIFILMSIVNAIFNLQFGTLTTVIIDFARDHDIDPSNDQFIMMCLSLMGACGMLGFGWVTDGGYLSRNRFASLLLFIGSVSLAVLPMTSGFTTLMAVLALWCVSQSSFVLLIPAIIAEHFGEDTQAVAVSACNVLCAPLFLIIPPLIGYFRDGQGSYNNIFFMLSGLSLLNSVAVFMVPCIARTKNAGNVS